MHELATIRKDVFAVLLQIVHDHRTNKRAHTIQNVVGAIMQITVSDLTTRLERLDCNLQVTTQFAIHVSCAAHTLSACILELLELVQSVAKLCMLFFCVCARTWWNHLRHHCRYQPRHHASESTSQRQQQYAQEGAAAAPAAEATPPSTWATRWQDKPKVSSSGVRRLERLQQVNAMSANASAAPRRRPHMRAHGPPTAVDQSPN